MIFQTFVGFVGCGTVIVFDSAGIGRPMFHLLVCVLVIMRNACCEYARNKRKELVGIFRLARRVARLDWRAQSALALCFLVFTTEVRSELVYVDPTGIQTKLNGFSAAEVGYNVTRTRVVSADDSEYTYDSKNALSKPARDNTTRSAPTSRLSMNQFNLAISRQTRTAIGMEAKLTYRVRGMVSPPTRS